MWLGGPMNLRQVADLSLLLWLPSFWCSEFISVGQNKTMQDTMKNWKFNCSFKGFNHQKLLSPEARETSLFFLGEWSHMKNVVLKDRQGLMMVHKNHATFFDNTGLL